MVVTKQKVMKSFAVYCGDCIDVLPEIKDESVGFSLFSPPFCSLYQYSDDDRDMGNADDEKSFFKHFSFLVEQLHRVIIPGRIVAVHCMDMPIFKRDGKDISIWDFPGEIIRCFEKVGFLFHSRHCIWKDPLIAAVRTHAIGLAHKQIVKDSTMCRMGIPDYIVAFRKKGENPKPVQNEMALTEYYGERKIPCHLDRFVGHKEAKTNKRSHWIWQQYASPVWFDIRQTYVLPFREARDGDDERHICPLQLDVIERCIALWSAKGDVVLTPFMGVGSEVYVAVKNGRKGVGIELKESYYQQALRNIKSLKKREHARKGFDL